MYFNLGNSTSGKHRHDIAIHELNGKTHLVIDLITKDPAETSKTVIIVIGDRGLGIDDKMYVKFKEN